jgi:uncharacterized protein (DUF433 family)
MATSEAAQPESPEVKVKEYGRYIVADPRICHGRYTFRGTRIFVDTVLEQVGDGEEWDAIVAAWDGKVSREAIGEAVHLARDVLRSTHEAWRQSNFIQLTAPG